MHIYEDQLRPKYTYEIKYSLTHTPSHQASSAALPVPKYALFVRPWTCIAKPKLMKLGDTPRVTTGSFGEIWK
jgi:hypothetical protein